MAITFEPPSTSSGPDPRQDDSPPKHKSIEELFASPTAQLPPRRGWQDRYQQHIWIGLISVLVIVLALSPIVLGFLSRPAAPATTPTAAPPTTVSVTASEFKFSPASIQMTAGQKVSITLQNTGVVEHDITVANTGFTLLAKSGQTATADFSFDKAGVFEFFCSIPGHKDTGMKGTFTVQGT